jgi:hypothetical protein
MNKATQTSIRENLQRERSIRIMPIPKDRRVVSSQLRGGKCGSRKLNMSGTKSKTGRYTDRSARRVPELNIATMQIMPGMNTKKDTLTSNLTQTLAIMAKIDSTVRRHSSSPCPGKCIKPEDLCPKSTIIERWLFRQLYCLEAWAHAV